MLVKPYLKKQSEYADTLYNPSYMEVRDKKVMVQDPAAGKSTRPYLANKLR
jgi:hypothetical protein